MFLWKSEEFRVPGKEAVFLWSRMGVVTFADPGSVQIAVETLRDVDVGDRWRPSRQKMGEKEDGINATDGSSISNRNLQMVFAASFWVLTQSGWTCSSNWVCESEMTNDFEIALPADCSARKNLCSHSSKKSNPTAYTVVSHDPLSRGEIDVILSDTADGRTPTTWDA